MVAIKPFKGFTPRPEIASQLASPPYDVLNSEEARILAQENPLSFLHVVKSEIDFEGGSQPSKNEIFQKAASNLKNLINSGNLVQDPAPCYYLYKQKMGEHAQIGLVCGSSVEDYNSGAIKKHEFTRKDKENERAEHVATLNANTGPVFLTYPHSDAMDELVSRITAGTPYIDFTATDNIAHTLWKVSQEADIQAITNIFTEIPATYVADGHHRAAAASRVQAQKKAANQAHTGAEDYNYFLTVVFPDNQMYIMDYNRVLKDLNGMNEKEVLAKLQEKFDIAELSVNTAEEAKPTKHTEFAMYLNKKWYKMNIHENLIPKSDPVNSLDAALLQNEVLAPIFGIDDPRTNNRIDFVGGIRGIKELERRCNEDCVLAFALYPTGIDQLINVADSGLVMPPKSTWFEPKLRSGMVVKTL